MSTSNPEKSEHSIQPQTQEPEYTQLDTPSKSTKPCIPDACLHYFFAYFLILFFGFVHGLYWFSFYPKFFLVPNRKTKKEVSVKRVFIWLLVYWANTGLFLFFRQTMLPWYIPCPGGEVMSPSCLFKHQETRYTFFYVMHLIFLLVGLGLWIYHGCAFAWWIRRLRKVGA